MNTYPEMNAKIVGLLELHGDPMTAYAAYRIRELESALREIAEHPHQNINGCVQTHSYGPGPWNNHSDNMNFFHGVSTGHAACAEIAKKALDNQ